MSEQDSLCLILASGSARRRELLAEAGYNFEVVVPGVEESAYSSEGAGAE